MAVVNVLPAARMTEAQWQQVVTDLAHACGFGCNHHRRSIGKGHRWTTATSVVGWPDLTIYGHGRLIFAELKTDTGKLTHEQVLVLASLRCTPAEVYVWRPSQLDEIASLLGRRAGHRRLDATL